MLHEVGTSFPFLYLDPDLIPKTHQWWTRKVSWLFDELPSADNAAVVLSKKMMAVDFFPYISRRFRDSAALRTPSQRYTFKLVDDAMARNAVIVLTRGKSHWIDRVAKLEKYPHLVCLKEVQRALVTPNNCEGDGFRKIVARAGNKSM